jgi:hypothetical protein
MHQKGKTQGNQPRYFGQAASSSLWQLISEIPFTAAGGRNCCRKTAIPKITMLMDLIDTV